MLTLTSYVLILVYSASAVVAIPQTDRKTCFDNAAWAKREVDASRVYTAYCIYTGLEEKK